MKLNKICALVLALAMLLCYVPCAFAASLPAAKDLTVSDGNGGFSFKWTPPASSDIAAFEVQYSAIGTGWMTAGTASGSADSLYVQKPKQGRFENGLAYTFRVQSIGANGEKGGVSNTVSMAYADDTGKLQAEFEFFARLFSRFSVSESGKKYNKVSLVKGTTVVYETSCYTLTAKVTKVKGSKVTLQTVITNKITAGLFYVATIGANGEKHTLKNTDVNAIKLTKTFDLSDISEGAASLDIEVKSTAGTKYQSCDGFQTVDSAYGGKSGIRNFKQKHKVCFQNAPKKSKLNADSVTVTADAISFGKAYKSSAKSVKESGSILYYKKASDKKWSTKTFTAGKTFKLTKLKAHTEYQLKTVNYVKALSAADGKTLVTSKSSFSNTLTVRTA